MLFELPSHRSHDSWDCVELLQRYHGIADQHTPTNKSNQVTIVIDW